MTLKQTQPMGRDPSNGSQDISEGTQSLLFSCETLSSFSLSSLLVTIQIKQFNKFKCENPSLVELLTTHTQTYQTSS